MPPTVTNEKSTYSTSAPGKSPPTSPSIFAFPEKTSRSDVSSPRYDRQKRNSSSSTLSWVSQEESLYKYGEQKTSDSSNRASWFSEEDSIKSPFSPSMTFEYNVDSGTLFGDGEFKSPRSAPKPCCPLESKVRSKVTHRPPISPGPHTPAAEKERERLYRYYQYLQTLKSTPKRESPGPRQLPALSDYNTSLYVPADNTQSGNRTLRYSDSSDIVTTPTPSTPTAKLTPKRDSPGPRELLVLHEDNTSLYVPADNVQSGNRKLRYSDSSDIVTTPTPYTPTASQEPAQTEFVPRSWTRYDPSTPRRQQSLPSGRKIGASLSSSSEKHHTSFSEAQASTPALTRPSLSAPLPDSVKRKLSYSHSLDIVTPPTPNTPSTRLESEQTEFVPQHWRRYDPSLRSGRSKEHHIKDIIPPSSSGSYLPPSNLADIASKGAPGKKHRKLGFSALRRKPRTIKKLCCNLAEEFSNRVPATRVRQKYSGKQPPDIQKQPLRTLAASTFNSFVSQPDLVGVMFYNSTTNKPGTLEDWTTHSKSNLGANQLFASVDCAKESSLCAREGISSLPFYKLYSSGSTVKVAKDLKNL